MVHAEQFRLRTNSDVKGDCHDYIGLCIFIYLYFSCICIFHVFVFLIYLYLSCIWISSQKTQWPEFGREDNIPLWTSERSGKLCGVRRDVNYEVTCDYHYHDKTLLDDNYCHFHFAWGYKCAKWKWSPPSHHTKILEDDNNYNHNANCIAMVIRVCEVIAMSPPI